MRRFLILPAVLLTLGTAGCGTVGNLPSLPGTPPPAPSKVKQAVLDGCGYAVTLESIAKIITASPFVPALGEVARAVCTAVTTLPFADGPGDRLPRVNGVVVRGKFVR